VVGTRPICDGEDGMAEGRNKDLFDRLGASGLRKRAAAPVTEAVRRGARKGRDQRVVREVIENLRKTAATRKRNA
jgi:hypothetical protein